MRTQDLDDANARVIDPNPFSVGLAIFAAIAGGGSFLETRRTNTFMQKQQRDAFRAIWFETRRSVIFFKRSIDEFETYMLEDGYGRRQFRIGSVHLSVDTRRATQLRRLRGQAMTTAQKMGDNLDDLSDHLGHDDQPAVSALLTKLAEIGGLPERYSDLVREGRRVVDLLGDLLNNIAVREGFEDDVAS